MCYLLTDVGERESGHDMNMEWKLLVFVDSLAGELVLDDARIIYLNKNEGFFELASKIKNSTFVVSGFKVIVLLIGRGRQAFL